jgi:hypothetical protein
MLLLIDVALSLDKQARQKIFTGACVTKSPVIN